MKNSNDLQTILLFNHTICLHHRFQKKKKIKEEKNKRIKINKIEEKYSQKERKKENKLLNRPRKAQNRLVLTERNFMAKV